MTTIVRTSGLIKRYPGTLAVAGLDLDVGEGEIFGLVGPNGAGKTTTLRILATLLTATAGEAEVAGINVRQAPYVARRRYLAQCLLPSAHVQLVHAETDGDALYSAALATGFRMARGEWVATLDADLQDDPAELPRLVAATKPGAEATMEVWRDGKRVPLKVTVGEIPGEVSAAKAEPRGKQTPNRLGLAVQELPLAERRTLGVDYALVVTEVLGPPAQGSPIQPGDIILAVNQSRFSSLEEFNKLIAQDKGSSLALLVRRGEAALYVPMTVG